MWNISLADYVWGSKKDSQSGFYGEATSSAYSLPTDSSGKTRLPTQADLTAATKPEDKLTLLRQMADVVNIQADAALTTGRADSLSGMTQSAKEVLSQLSGVVDGLKDSDGKVAESYQSGIANALGSLRQVMDSIGTLSSRASSEVAAQVTTDLTAMDNQASDLADSAGGTWRRTGSTFRADPTKLVDILV